MRFNTFSSALYTSAIISALPLCAQTSSKLSFDKWENLSSSYGLIGLQKNGISKRSADVSNLVDSASFSSIGDHYGARLRGYVTAPISGTYTFYVAGDDDAALWLSTDEKAINKQKLAYLTRHTSLNSWTTSATQKSVEIQLVAGQKYYIEAQVKEGGGGDHLSIGWEYSTNKVKNWVAEAGVVASQSSTGWGGSAARAIDGNTKRNWSEGSVTHTNSDQNAWWSTDLGADRSIEKIVLHNRELQSLRNRLSNFKVSVLNASGVEVASKTFYTDTDNNEAIVTWNLDAAVQGKTVKVEFLGYNRDGNGYLSLAEVEVIGSNDPTKTLAELLSPAYNTSSIEVIPPAHLSSYVAPTEDSNDNGLLDSFETQYGILPDANSDLTSGKYGEYGDFDNDGISNADEYKLGLNPAVRGSIAGKLTLESWVNLSGNFVKDLTSHDNFKKEPTLVELVDGVNTAASGTDSFGKRYKGMITAPVAGDYTFWISGDDEVELWLSDGSVKGHKNAYGKKKIAWLHDERFNNQYTSDEDFDRYASQRSVTITLEAGQSYYLEVLHKEGGGNDHVAIAWQKPGASREIIPSSVFKTYLPDLDDADKDNLPDAWESLNGLDATNNGNGNTTEGEYGDKDGDGLTNLQEYQLGTNPNSNDTDGDGLLDFAEVNYYETDATKSNVLDSSVHQQIALGNSSYSTGDWYAGADGSLTAATRRGIVTYEFTVTEAGIYEFNLLAGIAGNAVGLSKMPIELSLNGKIISKQNLVTTNGTSVSLKKLSPWLTPGNYTIGVRNKNFDAGRSLRIDSFNILKLGGIDANGNGVADWVEEKMAGENYLTRMPVESFTSPVTIEATTSHLSSASVSSTATDGTVSAQGVIASINKGFYSNIPLNATGTTAVTIKMQDGAVTENKQITWKTTNIIEQTALTVRKGDSLKLAAFQGANFNGTFTLNLNGVEVKNAADSTVHSSAYIKSFDSAGSYTYTATWHSADGTGTFSSNLIVNVLEADFGSAIDALAYKRRKWNVAGVSSAFTVNADDALSWNELTAEGDSSRSFEVSGYEADSKYVIARMPGTGEIIARGEVDVFDIVSATHTKDINVIQTYTDGTKRVAYTVVADNLPSGATVTIRTLFQGIIFDDGTTAKVLTADDFDINGLATIFMEVAPNTKVCHKLVIDFAK